MSELAIETSGLSKTYSVGFVRRRQVLALKELSLSVQVGQIYGLLGPNGAGKSTTIKILLNLVKQTAGAARVFGQAPSSTEARRLVGFLPENAAPYEHLTGREFVSFAGQLAGVSGAELKARTSELLEKTGMARAADLQIRRYSKGMIQRISLAQALVAKPRLLVLDEPTSGLDVLGRQLMRNIILEQRQLGTTVLFCSHIIPDVEALCDRVAVLIGGSLVREGSVTELLASEQAMMEATVEGVGVELLQGLKPLVSEVIEVGERRVLRFDEAQLNPVLEALLKAKARITNVQRTRYSLETLFIQAIAASGRSVGSEMP